MKKTCKEANKDKIKARNKAYYAYHKEMREMQEEAGFELSPLNENEL